MKMLAVAIFAMLLAGCASIAAELDRERVSRQEHPQDVQQMQLQEQLRQQQNQQRLQQYIQNNPVRNYDFQCVNDCQAAGYQRALCLSKCSY